MNFICGVTFSLIPSSLKLWGYSAVSFCCHGKYAYLKYMSLCWTRSIEEVINLCKEEPYHKWSRHHLMSRHMTKETESLNGRMYGYTNKYCVTWMYFWVKCDKLLIHPTSPLIGAIKFITHGHIFRTLPYLLWFGTHVMSGHCGKLVCTHSNKRGGLIFGSWPFLWYGFMV